MTGVDLDVTMVWHGRWSRHADLTMMKGVLTA